MIQNNNIYKKAIMFQNKLHSLPPNILHAGI